MTKAIIDNKQTITSLEILEQINFFREKEGKKKPLQHKTLLNIIRDEFEEEIGVQKILETSYKEKKDEDRHEQKILLMFRDIKIGNGATRKQPFYILPLSQGKQFNERKQIRKTCSNSLY